MMEEPSLKWGRAACSGNNSTLLVIYGTRQTTSGQEIVFRFAVVRVLLVAGVAWVPVGDILGSRIQPTGKTASAQPQIHEVCWTV